MSANLEFIASYNNFILSTMLDEEAFLAGLDQYVHEDAVLDEPASIPGLGRLVGHAGWNQWRVTAARWATESGAQYTFGASEDYEKGDVVLHWYELTLSPNAVFPEGFATSIIERYEFAEGKIARLAEYYADTTAFAQYFA